MQASVLADEDILHGCHIPEETDILVRAANTQADDLIRSELLQGSIPKEQRAFLRAVEPGDAIEERCLSSAVGANEADDAAFRHREIERVDSHQPAKPLGDAFCNKYVHGYASTGRCVVFDRNIFFLVQLHLPAP